MLEAPQAYQVNAAGDIDKGDGLLGPGARSVMGCALFSLTAPILHPVVHSMHVNA